MRRPPPASRPTAARRAGFTLMELVIVVLILSILWAAAAPRYREALCRARAEAAALRVAADLRYAQSNAKRTSKTYDVEFDIDDNSYELRDDDNDDNDDDDEPVDVNAKRLNRRTGDYEVRLADECQSQIVSADFGGDGRVTFDFYGHPDNSGTVVVASGGVQRTVEVNASGAVSIPDS